MKIWHLHLSRTYLTFVVTITYNYISSLDSIPGSFVSSIIDIDIHCQLDLGVNFRPGYFKHYPRPRHICYRNIMSQHTTRFVLACVVMAMHYRTTYT